MEVIVRLMPSGGYVTSSGTELVREYRTRTNTSGVWSLNLQRNADITPANTYYQCEERIPLLYGGPRKVNFQVGSSNQTLYAALLATPPSVPVTQYLTQAAGDARYVLSPGSFSATTADSRPNDAATAGVATSYARGDHVHERETTYGTAAARAALTGTDVYEGLLFQETDSTDETYFRRSGEWKKVTLPVVCTSATRPTNPYVGMVIYETDTGKVMTYYGATTGWNLPWGLPWGLVAVGTLTSDVTSIGTGGNNVVTSSTFTSVANRRYRVSGRARITTSSTGLTVFSLLEVTGTGLDLDIAGDTLGAASEQATVRPEYVGTLSVSASTVRLNIATSTGTVTCAAGSTFPTFVSVEDIGPLTATPPSP